MLPIPRSALVDFRWTRASVVPLGGVEDIGGRRLERQPTRLVHELTRREPEHGRGRGQGLGMVGDMADPGGLGG